MESSYSNISVDQFLVFLLVDLLHLGQDTREGVVKGVVVLVEESHLFQVNLLQDCGDIDALYEFLNALLKTVVLDLVIVVLLLGLLVGFSVILFLVFRGFINLFYHVISGLLLLLELLLL